MNPIDEVVKQQIAEAPVPYDPALWSAMEGKLAAHGLAKTVVWWKAWAWGMLLASVVGVLVFLLIKNPLGREKMEVAALSLPAAQHIVVAVPLPQAGVVMKGEAPTASPTGRPLTVPSELDRVFVASNSVSSQEMEAPEITPSRSTLRGLAAADVQPPVVTAVRTGDGYRIGVGAQPPKKHRSGPISPPVSKVPSSWFFEAGAKVGESYRTLIPDGSQSGQVINTWNWLEIPQTVAQAQILIGRRISPRMELRIGGRWATRGFADRKQSLIMPDPSPLDPISVQSFHTYYSLETPVEARYYVKKGKLRLFVEGGVAPSWLYNAYTTRAFEYLFGATEYREDGLIDSNTRKFQLSASWGFGVHWQFSKRWGAFAASSFDHQLMPIQIDAPINRQLYSWNGSFGLRYQLLRKSRKFFAMK